MFWVSNNALILQFSPPKKNTRVTSMRIRIYFHGEHIAYVRRNLSKQNVNRVFLDQIRLNAIPLVTKPKNTGKSDWSVSWGKKQVTRDRLGWKLIKKKLFVYCHRLKTLYGRDTGMTLFRGFLHNYHCHYVVFTEANNSEFVKRDNRSKPT